MNEIDILTLNIINTWYSIYEFTIQKCICRYDIDNYKYKP